MTPPYNCITNIIVNEDVDTWIPAGGRTVSDMPSYFANNAVFNALDFGAVGDNTTDNRAVLHTLANMTIPAGQELFLPPGTRTLIRTFRTLEATTSFKPGSIRLGKSNSTTKSAT